MGSKGKGKRQIRKEAVQWPVGRWRSAWWVLMGRAKTIEQIQGEWSVIQAQAAETFNRFNALAARLVRAERNMLAKSLDQMTEVELNGPTHGPVIKPHADRAAHKADLRRRAHEARRIPPAPRMPDVNRDQGREVSG